VTMTFTGGAASASFSNKAAPEQGESFTDDFGSGWSVTVSHADHSHSLLTTPSARAVFVAGTIASLLFGMLVFALGSGRKRALRMVARRTDELRHQALHDSLTQLPNRTLIMDRVEQMLVRCRRSGGVGAVLFLDLDGFKSVNDTLGHDAGDQLLEAVAARLTISLRGIDTIGRLGGDEFIVLVEDSALQADATLVAERILEVLRQPFELDLAPVPISISTSIGVATGDREVAGDLLRDADIALYEAKASGRNCYEVFRPDMEAAVQHQYELEFDLRSALDNDQFRLHYQPIYDLSDLTIVGTEALIRWDHPTRGMVQPGDFIPLLEASGQIIEVGRWVLVNACCQAQQWLDNGDDLTVAVNVSARQLDRDSIIVHVSEALKISNLDPGHLTIEITESAIMKDTDLTARRLHALKALGVKIAIDDFGTGYSSLAYLQRFPVDCLKIDRTFINAIARSPESDALINTFVQLGKDLGMTTLAEGVETTGQLDHLRSADVDRGQGFLLARPLSVAVFESQLLLRTRSTTSAAPE
ncbi:MAG: EAL domain-containing protein, partial [Acidimicrobiales bacterium]